MPGASFIIKKESRPPIIGKMPIMMKKSLMFSGSRSKIGTFITSPSSFVTVAPLSYVNIPMPNTSTVAMTGITESMVFTLPRLLTSVTSATQVLNAASLAVEPKKVITQSSTTSTVMMPQLRSSEKSMGMAAKSIIVTPQRT